MKHEQAERGRESTVVYSRYRRRGVTAGATRKRKGGGTNRQSVQYTFATYERCVFMKCDGEDESREGVTRWHDETNETDGFCRLGVYSTVYDVGG